MSTSTEQSAPAKAPPGLTPPTATGGRSGFLSDVIVELGFATQETVEQAVRAARSPGTTVARVLVEMRAISEEQLARGTAERYGIDYIDLEAFEVDPAAAHLINSATARRYQAVPVGFLGERLLVAMADPADALALNNIAAMTDRQAHPAVASLPALDALLEALLLDEWQPNEDSAAPALAEEAVPEQPAVAPTSVESAGASQLRAELSALKSQLAGAEAKLEATRAEAKAKDEAAEGPNAAGLQAKLADAEVELEGARARVREAKEVSAELETLREALAAAEAGLDARARQGGEASADTHDLRARLADMENERNAARERVDSLKAERDEARERARKVESELRRLSADVEVRSGELDSLRNKLTDAETELVRVRVEVDSRGSEIEALRKRAQSAEAEAETVLRRVAEVEGEFEGAQGDAADTRAEAARRALCELRGENERERERWAIAERDLRKTLSEQETRRAELEQRLGEVEGSAFAAERAFDELRLAQGRMRETLRGLAGPDAPQPAGED